MHPLFNDNKLKLGLFALNSGGTMMTLAPDRFQADWRRCDEAMRLAGELGIEAMVSLATWSERREFESFTWSAALGARHPGTANITTFHVQLMHPTFVAKAVATLDHITDGRAAINIVAGSNPATYAAFGQAFEDHNTRYAHAEEFVRVLDLLWSAEGPVDFEGRFYKLNGAYCIPKPMGRPPIMNAGTSERGLDFAARFADIVFTHLPEGDLEGSRALIAHCKDIARQRYQRKVQVWTHAYVVMRDTQEEADAFLRYYAEEHADHARVEAWTKTLTQTADSKVRDEESWKFKRNWAAGGGIGLVGTPQRVAEQLVVLSELGLDGILLNSTEPENMLAYSRRGLLPLLEQAGVREAHRG
jgi:alkanesulfonate monooxygenase SsuD/methylene tetrahydromethanopterin reductase-like flavin-dependent oxidoreductase (luciferase family)